MLVSEDIKKVKELLGNTELRVLIRKGNWDEFWAKLPNYLDSKQMLWAYNTLLQVFSNAGVNCTLTSMPPGVFENDEIGDLKLPEGLIDLPDNTFINAKVGKITLPSTLKYIRRSAFMSSNLTEIVIPPSVTFIDWMAFAWAPIEKLELNEGLKTISQGAFCMCALPEITIPKSVELLDKGCIFNLNDGKEFTVNLPEKWRDEGEIRRILGLRKEDCVIDTSNNSQWQVSNGIYNINVNFY